MKQARYLTRPEYNQVGDRGALFTSCKYKITLSLIQTEMLHVLHYLIKCFAFRFKEFIHQSHGYCC